MTTRNLGQGWCSKTANSSVSSTRRAPAATRGKYPFSDSRKAGAAESLSPIFERKSSQLTRLARVLASAGLVLYPDAMAAIGGAPRLHYVECFRHHRHGC